MGRPPAVAVHGMEQALELIRTTNDSEALRAAQAVVLPLLGFTLDEAARIVGRDRYWVSRARNRLLRGGSPPVQHGGRRRSLVPKDQEVVLVKRAIAQPGVPLSARAPIRKALLAVLEEQSGQPVSDSTVTLMLERVAPKILSGASAADLQREAGEALARQWHYENLVAMFLGRDRG